MKQWTMAVVLALGLFGCRSSDDSSGMVAVEQRHEKGEVSVTLRVDREQITVADPISVTLEVTAPEGERLIFPATGEKLGEFTVTDTSEAGPRLVEGNKVQLGRIYELEPFLPGDYEVPPLTVEFGEDQGIVTDPVSISVVSVLPEGAEDPELKGIAAPVDLPGSRWWLYAAVFLALAAAAWLLWRRFRKKPARGEPTPLAHEVALRAMSELMAEDLISKGQAKLFYLRLSAILRHYIEDRFGLHAPERTTEEFLRDLRAERTFDDRQKGLLEEFLVHCDMVKFAGYNPSREEIESAINTCGQFIAETKPTELAARTPEPVGSGD